VISDSAKSRKCFLGIFSILWSLTTFMSSFATSFYVFAILRALLGVFESACNPLIFSLIKDYFPPSHRSTANAILTSSIYLGTTISSLSIILIDSYGWR
jgi:MFS family permease